MDGTQKYIFSTYWVCQVITTVGYGNYTGGTTVEYLVTLFLEFFGILVFTALQMAVNRVANGTYAFGDYFNARVARIELWLLTMEKSN